MKRSWFLLLAMILVPGASNSNAVLIDRGVGLIYDSDLGIGYN